MQASPSPSSPKPSRLRRWLKWTLSTVALLLVVLVLLASLAWWWAGQSDSLRRTLDYASTWLPEGQTLQTRNVQGSLRAGGSIEWLHWSNPSLDVEVQNAELAWQLSSLWDLALHFDRIHLQTLKLRSTPLAKSEKSEPVQPLQSLTLPLHLHVPVRIEELQWQGAPAIDVQRLYATYDYNGSAHTLHIDSLHYAQGQYTAQVQLQAQAPMQLQASLQGLLQAPLPETDTPHQPLNVTAKADISGTLATEDAQLALTLSAQSAPHDALPAQPNLSLQAQAQVRPWLSQPLEQLQAQMQHLDVALFWPQGPRTDLQGHITVNTLENNHWQLQAEVNNALAGPWDQHALPIQQLHAQAQFDGLHTWSIDPVRIALNASQTSYLQAQGSFNTQTQAFNGQLALHAVQPEQLASTFKGPPISGTLQAQSDAEQEVQFQLQLQSAQTKAPQALTALTSGTWKAPVLQLGPTQLQAFDAQLQSKQIQLDTSTWFFDGNFVATAPGLRTELTAKASPTQGNGTLELQLSNAQTFAQWLQKLPVPIPAIENVALQGDAQAHLSWRGGWTALQQRLLDPSKAWQKSDLQLELQVQSKQLHYQAPQAQAIDLQAFNLALAGTPQALKADVRGQATLGPQQLQLNSSLTAGLSSSARSAAQDWYATLQTLQIQWDQLDQNPKPWLIELQAPVGIQSRSLKNGLQIQAAAGHITVAPPTPDASAASLQWEPTLLMQKNNGTWGIQSAGKLHGIPLIWVDAFNAQHSLLDANGISGDLSLQGSWDIDNTQSQLRAHAVLERASGDIRLSVEDPDAANITIVRSTGATVLNANTQQVQSRTISTRTGRRAGIETLRLEVAAQGESISAELLLASKRAGKISAKIQSQLDRASTGWTWQEQAPLTGSVKATVPDLGLWALFPPPGWRVGGALEADITIAGTRKAPSWNGTLNANQLFVQSLLDGVDLRDGQLRATLRDTRLNITDISFTGGEGSRTRILGPSGNLTNAPQAGGTFKGAGFVEYDPTAPASSSGIRMDIRATLDHLQVLVRADRQISVSGQLQALLNHGQLDLNGNLTVDRATIILADDSGPTIGEDVHITSAASRLAAQKLVEQKAAQSQGSVQASVPPKINVVLNLGEDFALQGYGITTRLKGELNIAAGPRITGTIETVNGRYRAWGQLLDVEQGTIRFNGPYDNPAIDIVAIRPNVDIRVGVQVTGSANSPRIALFSDTEMSDAEKLSWILMGRGAAGGGTETALLQQAALALLSGDGSKGNFAGLLGLDEIGFKGPSADGEEAAAITVGKRLSKDLYIAYEQSLSGAMGTLFIFYDLTRRLTLRGQTGEQSAVDLIYTTTSD